MNLFDEFNALQILKNYDEFCNARPYCRGCPLYAKSISQCAIEMSAENRKVWQENLKDKISAHFEESEDEQE